MAFLGPTIIRTTERFSFLIQVRWVTARQIANAPLFRGAIKELNIPFFTGKFFGKIFGIIFGIIIGKIFTCKMRC